MSKIDPAATPAEQEAQFLANAGELFEKSASAIDAPSTGEFTDTEPSRLEERLPDPPDTSPDEETDEPQKARGEWRGTPTVKDQWERYPDTIKLTDPETKILDLSEAEDLREFNRIQKGAASNTAPTYAITDLDKQHFEGKWTVFITFCKVLYHTL